MPCVRCSVRLLTSTLVHHRALWFAFVFHSAGLKVSYVLCMWYRPWRWLLSPGMRAPKKPQMLLQNSFVTGSVLRRRFWVFLEQCLSLRRRSKSYRPSEIICWVDSHFGSWCSLSMSLSVSLCVSLSLSASLCLSLPLSASLCLSLSLSASLYLSLPLSIFLSLWYWLVFVPPGWPWPPKNNETNLRKTFWGLRNRSLSFGIAPHGLRCFLCVIVTLEHLNSKTQWHTSEHTFSRSWMNLLHSEQNAPIRWKTLPRVSCA